MADFDIKAHGKEWLLTPTNRVARTWCKSNLSEELRQVGDGYVVDEARLLLIIEDFGERKPNLFGF